MKKFITTAMTTKTQQNKQMTTELIHSSTLKKQELFVSLNSSNDGLTEAQIVQKLEHHGKNLISQSKANAWYIQLLSCFKNPFIVILLGLASFSYCTDDMTGCITISTMVIVSVIITFTQQYRSSQVAEKLKAMVKTTATVTRKATNGSETKDIDMESLVPGDIIQLSSGDMIPADVRLILAKDLSVSESALTGEVMPVEKRAQPLHITPTNVLELGNICFMGTNVVSGTATGIVLSTGTSTYLGSMASSLNRKSPMTSFDKGIRSITFLLLRMMYILVPIILLINGFTKGNWWEALLFGVSIAVGLTPEMLPVIVSANLAKGAAVMAKHDVVVKNLHSIQNFGAMNILCTDKTGTLTEDKMVLENYFDIYGQSNDEVLYYGYLNSYHQTGLKSLLDKAIIEQFEWSNDLTDLNYYKIDEIPFDFSRRRMSVILKHQALGHQLLICKGAVEEIIQHCSHISDEGQIIQLADARKNELMAQIHTLNTDGLRVLAVAIKHMTNDDTSFSLEDEHELVLIGYLTFRDPAKKSAKAAIECLQSSGIDVKVITGDNAAIARKVCQDIGLVFTNILQGCEIEQLEDNELALLAEKTTIFAKVNPLQKARIIRVLKANGHTVGFMGDGINDTLALKEADVGISVDSAVDIAKDSADIILLEKSLMVLEKGVLEGRKIYGNMIKYIKMTLSSNFGNIFSVLIASIALPFLPMLPIHLLIQNLLYDISQLSLPWDVMDEEFLKSPKKWDASSLRRFMVIIGPISSIFDVITFLVMWYIFSANNIGHQALFQSGWFTLGLLSQTLIVHMIRTEKLPFLQSKASLPVTLLTSAVMLLGIAFPFTLFGANVGLQALPLRYFAWLAIILISYCAVIQLVKMWYIRRFGEWL
jgi:Mg2+-importing ATPase